MAPRVIDGIEIDLCSPCCAAWLDTGEAEKLSAYLEDDQATRRGVPISMGPQSAYEDFGILSALFDALLGRPFGDDNGI